MHIMEGYLSGMQVSVRGTRRVTRIKEAYSVQPRTTSTLKVRNHTHTVYPLLHSPIAILPTASRHAERKKLWTTRRRSSSVFALLFIPFQSEISLNLNCARGVRWTDNQARFPTNGYPKRHTLRRNLPIAKLQSIRY